jgi:fructokinase
LLSPHAKAATLKFAKTLRRARGVLVVDLNVRAHLWSDSGRMRREVAELLRHADIVKGSEVDAAALGGWAWIRAQATGAGADTIWLETRGPKPSRARGRFGVVACHPARERVVDATGAGDAFIAGVLATLVRCAAHPTLPVWRDRALWHGALTIGNELARKAISRPGAVRGVVGLRPIQRALRVAAERVQS